MLLASDQKDANVAKKLRARAATSTAATHVDSRQEVSKIMSKAVKSGSGKKETAEKRKKAFHKRWLEGGNAKTIEEFAWQREFLNS
ncbi:MAG: hypothetical protein CMO20_06570 [Thermoplasmata archaeon]|nr:hypothetical protein [Thermoplasmata archaeon]